MRCVREEHSTSLNSNAYLDAGVKQEIEAIEEDIDVPKHDNRDSQHVWDSDSQQ